jgi:hypothetical protein
LGFTLNKCVVEKKRGWMDTHTYHTAEKTQLKMGVLRPHKPICFLQRAAFILEKDKAAMVVLCQPTASPLFLP